DDLTYQPIAREKPPLAYFDSYQMAPSDGASWRGATGEMSVGANMPRHPLGGRDFSMWTCFPSKWTDEMNAKADSMSLYDGYFALSPPEDILKKFHEQFAGRNDVP